MNNQIIARRPRLGSRVSSLLDTSLVEAEVTAKASLKTVANTAEAFAHTAKAVANGFKEMEIETASDVEDALVNSLITRQANIARLVDAGYSEEDATALLTAVHK